jgi:hypothetical protein
MRDGRKVCFHCGHPVDDGEFLMTIEDGPVKVNIASTREKVLCPYCFSVVLGDEDEE